jgi:hypothetical protein
LYDDFEKVNEYFSCCAFNGHLQSHEAMTDVNDEPGTSGNSQQRNANPHPNLGLKSVFVYSINSPGHT